MRYNVEKVRKGKTRRGNKISNGMVRRVEKTMGGVRISSFMSLLVKNR